MLADLQAYPQLIREIVSYNHRINGAVAQHKAIARLAAPFRCAARAALNCGACPAKPHLSKVGVLPEPATPPKPPHLSILPVLASVLIRRPGALAGWQQRLQRVDRALVDAAPWVGRYCWETVLVLEL